MAFARKGSQDSPVVGGGPHPSTGRSGSLPKRPAPPPVIVPPAEDVAPRKLSERPLPTPVPPEEKTDASWTAGIRQAKATAMRAASSGINWLAELVTQRAKFLALQKQRDLDGSLSESTQECLDLLESMIGLARRFEMAAVDECRTIINEMALPEDKRSIKRVNPGAPVYLSKNMIFEVSTAPGAETHFGSMESAAKITSVGLRALQSLLSVMTSNPAVIDSDTRTQAIFNQIQLDLRMMVDYLGHRIFVSAKPLLDNAAQLIMGPGFATTAEPAVQRLFSRALQSLFPAMSHPEPANHGVEVFRSNPNTLHITSDRILLTPPTLGDEPSVDVIPGNKFRVEFCAMYPQLLRFDANVDERRAAMSHLYEHNVKLAAQFLDKHCSLTPLDKIEVSNILHRCGVNLRYMGQVYKHSQELRIRTLLLVEMISRFLKRQMRAKWRHWIRVQQQSQKPGSFHALSQDDSQLRIVTAEFVNLVFGQNTESRQYWDAVIKSGIEKSFRFPASAATSTATSSGMPLLPTKTLHDSVSHVLLLKRFKRGLFSFKKPSAAVFQRLFLARQADATSQAALFKISPMEVRALIAHCKAGPNSYIFLEDAKMALQMISDTHPLPTSDLSVEFGAIELFKRALQDFDVTCRVCPADPHSYSQWAQAIVRLATSPFDNLMRMKAISEEWQMSRLYTATGKLGLALQVQAPATQLTKPAVVNVGVAQRTRLALADAAIAFGSRTTSPQNQANPNQNGGIVDKIFAFAYFQYVVLLDYAPGDSLVTRNLQRALEQHRALTSRRKFSSSGSASLSQPGAPGNEALKAVTQLLTSVSKCVTNSQQVEILRDAVGDISKFLRTSGPSSAELIWFHCIKGIERALRVRPLPASCIHPSTQKKAQTTSSATTPSLISSSSVSSLVPPTLRSPLSSPDLTGPQGAKRDRRRSTSLTLASSAIAPGMNIDAASSSSSSISSGAAGAGGHHSRQISSTSTDVLKYSSKVVAKPLPQSSLNNQVASTPPSVSAEPPMPSMTKSTDIRKLLQQVEMNQTDTAISELNNRTAEALMSPRKLSPGGNNNNIRRTSSSSSQQRPPFENLFRDLPGSSSGGLGGAKAERLVYGCVAFSDALAGSVKELLSNPAAAFAAGNKAVRPISIMSEHRLSMTFKPGASGGSHFAAPAANPAIAAIVRSDSLHRSSISSHQGGPSGAKPTILARRATEVNASRIERILADSFVRSDDADIFEEYSHGLVATIELGATKATELMLLLNQSANPIGSQLAENCAILKAIGSAQQILSSLARTYLDSASASAQNDSERRRYLQVALALFVEYLDDSVPAAAVHEFAVAAHDMAELTFDGNERLGWLHKACSFYNLAFQRFPDAVASSASTMMTMKTSNMGGAAAELERKAESRASCLSDWAAALGDIYNMQTEHSVQDQIATQMLDLVIRAYQVFPKGSIKKNLFEFHKVVAEQLNQRAVQQLSYPPPKKATGDDPAIQSLRRAIDVMTQLQKALLSALQGGPASGAEEADRKATLLYADSLLLDVYINALQMATQNERLYPYVTVLHDSLLALVKQCWDSDKAQAMYYRARTFAVMAAPGSFIPNLAPALEDVIRASWRAKAAERFMWAERVIAVTPQHPLYQRVAAIGTQMQELVAQAIMTRVRIPLNITSSSSSNTKKSTSMSGSASSERLSSGSGSSADAPGCLFRITASKLGAVVKNWKERVFCVRDTSLEYFKTSSLASSASSPTLSTSSKPKDSKSAASAANSSNNAAIVGKTKGTIDFQAIEDIDLMTKERKWVVASKDKMTLDQLRDALIETLAWGRSVVRVAMALDPTLRANSDSEKDENDSKGSSSSSSSSSSSASSAVSKRNLNRGITFNTMKSGNNAITMTGLNAAAGAQVAPPPPPVWRDAVKSLVECHRNWVLKFTDPVLD